MGRVGYLLAFVGVAAGAYAFTLNPMQSIMGSFGVAGAGAAPTGWGFMGGLDGVTKREMIWTASLVFVSLGVVLVIADQFMKYLQGRFPLAPSIEDEFEK